MPQVLTIRYEVEIVEASQGQLKGHIDPMMAEKHPRGVKIQINHGLER